MKWILGFLILIFSIDLALSQSIFSLDNIHFINIKIDTPEYKTVLSNNYSASKKSSEIPYINASIEIDGERIDSVGIRYKGASSYVEGANKKSLKIDFNEYIKKQHFQGLIKLNLHNSFADPSFIRDAINYHLFREIGVKAPRLSFAQVYINKEYMGIYHIVEQIDKKFVKGNLFKNMGWENLTYLNNSAGIYRKTIDLKGKDEYTKWLPFINLLKIFQEKDLETFKVKFQEVMDVEVFLKVLAVYVATNNHDSILKTGRNWYLNQKTDTSRFEWIPWDTNYSFGAIYPSAKDCSTLEAKFCALKKDKRQVQFIDKSKFTTAIDYQWTFGDGSISNERDPMHKYKRKGKYNVCLEVKLKDLCIKQDCQQIDIKSLPEVCKQTELRPLADFEYDFFAENSQNFLIKKVLAVEEFRDQYRSILCAFLEESFSTQELLPFIEEHNKLLSVVIKEDPNLLDTFEEFNLETKEHTYEYSLFTFIQERRKELTNTGNCKI